MDVDLLRTVLMTKFLRNDLDRYFMTKPLLANLPTWDGRGMNQALE
jgi:hypothetical protein